MNKLLATTMAFGVILTLGSAQPSQADCGCSGSAAPAPSYGYVTSCSSCWDPYYNNYAHNYYGQGLVTQIVNSLL